MKTIKIAIVAAVMCATALTANAQKWGSNPEDSAKCVLNTSLYQESYKMKDYAGAYEPWREVVKNCPKSSKNLYIRGTTILKQMMSKAKTKEERNAYIDELMALYDTRIANFGEAGEVLFKKAYDMELLKGKDAVQQYYPIYAEAIKASNGKQDADYVYKFFEATINYVVKGYGDSSLVVDNYDIASDMLDAELTAKLDDSVEAAKIRVQIANVEAAFSPFASCDQLVKIYAKKFAAESENVDLLKKITNIMRKKGCTNEQLFFDATEKLYSLEPSPNTAFMMGQMCYSKEKYGEAVKYLKDAVEGIKESKDLYKAYILLGAAYAGQSSYSAARSSYYKAAELEPTKGEPYLQIAQLYARGSRSVDDGMGGRSAYWAAVDKAVRAKNVDSSPENIEAANKLIGTYSSYYPKQNDAFMLDLIDGHSYVVPGWIGESTTVRTRK